jgi:hypothetical protein
MNARIRPARPGDVDRVLALWAHADVEPTVTETTELRTQLMSAGQRIG